MPRALRVEITDDDLTYANPQDRYACVIVRALQRQLPEAKNVLVDTETIRFSLESDKSAGDQGTRYTFQTPKRVVTSIIKCFDRGADIQQRSFVLDEAIHAQAIVRRTAEQRASQRTRKRIVRARNSENRNVRTTNRYLDSDTQ